MIKRKKKKKGSIDKRGSGFRHGSRSIKHLVFTINPVTDAFPERMNRFSTYSCKTRGTLGEKGCHINHFVRALFYSLIH